MRVLIVLDAVKPGKPLLIENFSVENGGDIALR
jgi:hypothetical protein